MCGIAGYSGQFPSGLLNRMNAVIAHRGPDGWGEWMENEAGIGLAHQRLTILDLSKLGDQPMWDLSHRVVVVYNGEIYNYRDLRLDLAKDGYKFRSNSDTEIILNLYLKHGTEMLAKLNGIFAFALWDTRTQSLFLARDAVGVKPLYYTSVPKGFLFASEIKSLLEEKSVDRALDPDALRAYLTYLYSPAPDTMFRAVKKLEPGHALVVTNGQIVRHWEYYDLPYAQPIAPITEKDATEVVRSHIREAVRRQMVSDVPVGSFLSGGLDSSSVVAFAREFSGNSHFPCFTIGFKDASWAHEGMAEDIHYARRVAKLLDVELHTVEVGSDFADHIERAVYHLEEPQADPAAINVLFISELARSCGIKVLLSGTGGDDIFTGYRRHLALSKEWTWSWLPQAMRVRMASVAASLSPASPMGRRLNKAFLYADLRGDERIVSYLKWARDEATEKLLGPQIRDTATRPVAAPMLQALKRLPPQTPPLNKMLYLDSKFFLADHNLNYTDKMGMAVGVEIRVPLLDTELIALAARLPLGLKQHGATGKYIFKRAMEPYLPRDIIYRPKTGFGAPVRKWLREELRPMVEDVLSAESLLRHGLFDPKGVQKLLLDDREGRIDGTYTILAILFIELWYRIFIERSSFSRSSIAPVYAGR